MHQIVWWYNKLSHNGISVLDPKYNKFYMNENVTKIVLKK